MKLRQLTAAACLLFAFSPALRAGDPDTPATATGQTEVQWHKFDEALVQAKASGKHIMVDVYTDWCGWCKKLDRETYTDSGVLKVLAESYVSAKLKGDDASRRLNLRAQPIENDGKTLLQIVPADEESISEKDLTRGALHVQGFPTILFFSPDGRMITKLSGFQRAESFTNILNFVKDDLYEVMSYQDYIKSLAAKEEDKEKS